MPCFDKLSMTKNSAASVALYFLCNLLRTPITTNQKILLKIQYNHCMQFSLKSISKFKTGNKKLLDLSVIHDSLCNGLFDVMETSFAQRAADNHNSKYTPEDVDKIIEVYTKNNMMIAAASSIVPGPFGILGSVPELLLNFKNQMNMIYDLGCANGKESFINKDVLLDIPVSAFGGNTNLTSIQDSSVDLMDSPESVLKEKSFSLGKSIIERTMKKSIVQFVPIAGPILMGTWAKMTTAKISKGTMTFLDDRMTFIEHVKPDENDEITKLLQIEKIKGLANLIESNNEINENQIEMIGSIIENSNLDESEKEYYLQESIKTGSKFELDKELLKTYEEDDDLIMQLVVMAKRSGSIDLLEKEYIYAVGQELELEYGFVDALFD